MLLTILGLIPGLAQLFTSYLNHQASEGTEQERIQANMILGMVQERQKANATDAQFFSLRLPKAFFFLSVSFYVSIIFIASALGIDPAVFAVKRIPENLDYIPYAVVGYWTLNVFKGK